MSLETHISRVLPAVIELRHRLHRIPEILYEEYQTAAMIRSELDRLGVAYVAGVPDAPTATVAWLGDVSKPCVALRADIDALPIVERTGLAYSSTRDAFMHACGHDGHTATLLGTIAVVQKIIDDLPVCVKFLWQPAEEGGGGAERLVSAGVLDGRLGPKVSAIFGLHGWPGLKVGTVATKAGALLAATSSFEATFTGRGCHGAFPHLGIDPIVTACEAVSSLQKTVSREYDPTDSAVVTVGMIRGGSAVNVIPDTTTIEGTMRALSIDGLHHLQQSVRRRCAGIAAANGCQLHFAFEPGYPPTINDPVMADFVANVASTTFGSDRFIPVARSAMGGEDFAYYLQKVPGCFFLIGVEPHDRAGHPSLHSDQFDFTDAAIPVGMRMFVELLRQFIR